MSDNEEVVNETPTVENPEGLLAAYNKLKADIKTLATERDGLKTKLESVSQDQYRLKALTAEAKLALQGQGIKDADRLMPYIGTEGLDFDEEGVVTGLSERLEQLKKDLPEVFDAKKRAGGKADIFANDAVEAQEDPLRAQVRKAQAS